MKTIVNIGTNVKNITGVEFDKAFEDITFPDIVTIVVREIGDMRGVRIEGWCDVTRMKKKNKK